VGVDALILTDNGSFAMGYFGSTFVNRGVPASETTSGKLATKVTTRASGGPMA
jgi:hypothetical protein